MVAAAERLIAEWRAMPTGSMHAIDDDMTRVTFQVTMLTGGDAAEGEGLERSNQTYIGPIAWPLLYAPFRLPNWLPFPGKSGRHRAEGTCGRRLNASCAPRAANSAIATTSILERLLRAKNPDTGEAMSDVQVVDNLLTFLRAGLAPDTERLRMMGFPLLASAGGDAQQRQSR
jgi:cytochrome P450